MINKLSDSKTFSFINKKYNFSTNLSKLKLSDYKIPEEFILDKITVFKGYKYPFVEDVIKLVKNRKIIACDFSMKPSKNVPGLNIHLDCKLPKSIITLAGLDEYNQPVIYVDLSNKGKYVFDIQGNASYYNIPELVLYHLFTNALIQYNLLTKPEYSENTDLITKISEAYALVMSKIIDNMFPIISTTNTGFDRIFFLCTCFSLQILFNLDKETAIKYAIKSRFIGNKELLKNESLYFQTSLDFTENVNVVNNKFPIDVFCEIVCKEFDFIDEKSFNFSILLMKFVQRMNQNSQFCIDSGTAFITMLVLGTASIGLYNDMMIKQYLKLANFDIIKEFAHVMKK